MEVAVVDGAGFFGDEPGVHLLYRACQDSEFFQDVRDWVEAMWARYRPYCGDRHFLADAREHFPQRTWEVLCGCLLLEHGFVLECARPDSPDVRTSIGGVPFLFEAMAPTAGDGANAVRRIIQQREEFDYGDQAIYMISREQIVLRYTGAVREKLEQHARFLRRGTVGPSDGYVVAINAGLIPDADIHRGLPDIVRAVFPLGDPVYTMRLGIDDGPRMKHRYRDAITTASGATVRTTAFLTEEYAPVSAILFCPHGVWNLRTLEGRSCIIIHNPKANVPLPRGTLGFGTEYWAEGNRLRWSGDGQVPGES